MPLTAAQAETPPLGLPVPTAEPEVELSFPLGLPGFPGEARYGLRPMSGLGGPFHLLQGLGAARIGLVVVPMQAVAGELDDADVDGVRAELEIAPASLLVLLVVTLAPRGSGQPPTVNLRAPIFVDVDRRTAVQVVLPRGSYPFRQPLAA